MIYQGKALSTIATEWLNGNARQRNKIELDLACLFESIGIRFAMINTVGFQECFVDEYAPRTTEMRNIVIQVNNGDVHVVIA